jgi:hypothetical protein
MNTPISYQTAFILNKAHYGECFDQSVVTDTTIKPYYKAMLLFVVGLILLFVVGTNYYGVFFVVALAALEAVSVRYRKAWWLARQMLSKASNSEITLVIDEQGITTKSFHVNGEIKWCDVSEIKQTDQGLLIIHPGGTNYISKSCLGQEVQEFILSHKNK